MVFLSGLLTFFLVLDCIVLVFLVLIQLPKKEAGAGLAFGGAASDALFGAGSGNVLTKITKYAAGTFFVVAILLSLIQGHIRTSGTSRFQQRLEAAPANTPSTPQQSGPVVSTNKVAMPPAAESTTLPLTPATTNVTPPPASK
jgi:preprotein translocase subunit SecG